MAGLDFDKARRAYRAVPTTALARRPDSALPFLSADVSAGPGLLLDTCVYIDQMQGRLPDLALTILAIRQPHHSTIGQQELMFSLGRLDPSNPATRRVVAAVGMLIQSMPAHRVLTPDGDCLGRAALLAGIVSRLQGYADDRRLRALADCTLFLQAVKAGLTVLTANVADFDILLQIEPKGRVLFYRPSSARAA